MGNKVLIKPDVRTGIPVEQFVRLLHYCGVPKNDLSLIFCHGPVMSQILVKGGARMTAFTGSFEGAEKLCATLKGKIKVEDAGFDWKILGPDTPKDQKMIDYIAW